MAESYVIRFLLFWMKVYRKEYKSWILTLSEFSESEGKLKNFAMCYEPLLILDSKAIYD